MPTKVNESTSGEACTPGFGCHDDKFTPLNSVPYEIKFKKKFGVSDRKLKRVPLQKRRQHQVSSCSQKTDRLFRNISYLTELAEFHSTFMEKFFLCCYVISTQTESLNNKLPLFKDVKGSITNRIKLIKKCTNRSFSHSEIFNKIRT